MTYNKEYEKNIFLDLLDLILNFWSRPRENKFLSSLLLEE